LIDCEERTKLVKEQLRLAIYFAREFIDELDKEKAPEIIERVWIKYGADNWKDRLAGIPPEDIIKTMREWFKAQVKIRSEIRVIEATPERMSIESTQYPQYDVCKEMGVPEIYQKYCDSDYGAAALMHPKLKMARDKELAYGATTCNHSWIMGK
jgi:hypothetical protein